jgi:catechol 2,3-dioxygenase-like lactoylglutathione lyase family enzyme
MADLPPPPDGMVLTHFIVSDDVERSKRFYTEVLGGRVAFPGDPVNVALANSWIVINSGGGPTDDKPTVILETPRDPDRVSSFLNIRVKDIDAVYAAWSARGAHFLTPPKQHPYEKRCYIRDPDGHLIEVGQTTDPNGDWSPAHWPASTPADEARLLTHQTSGEVAANLANREVECRFERTGIAFGLGEQQATLQGSEGSQREPVDIGVGIQLAPVSHAPEPVADRGFPAVEAGRERGPGGFVGLGQLAGQ